MIWGWVVDEDAEDDVRVTVIATGFEESFLNGQAGGGGRSGLGGGGARDPWPTPKAPTKPSPTRGQGKAPRKSTDFGTPKKPTGRGTFSGKADPYDLGYRKPRKGDPKSQDESSYDLPSVSTRKKKY